jgi:hypothetical protein
MVGTQKPVAQNHGGIITAFAEDKFHLCVVIVESVYKACVCVWSCVRACMSRTRQRKVSLLQTHRFALFNQEIQVFITFHEIPKSVLRFALLGHTHHTSRNAMYHGALTVTVIPTIVYWNAA